MQRLQRILRQIEGQGYKAYKRLVGQYTFEHFLLNIDHVQGDPYALPSRISLRVAAQTHKLPPEWWGTRGRQTALEDFLARSVDRAMHRHVKGGRGTGHSGEIRIAVSGQQVLRRNAVLVDGDVIEVRLLLALPADGRSLRAADARAMLCDELPRVVVDGLCGPGRDPAALRAHVAQVEDQQFLRDWLSAVGGVAFIADGSMLARRSGIDDRPLANGVSFVSPDGLRREVDLPNSGRVSGMMLPRGVSLITGGGFHGKSTLLQALERGVYDHIPGDGRELVVTTPGAVKIRAEDHRAIHRVDISPFIGTLPGGRPTTDFTTDNASGSTSQAANIVEALECGCDCLLIDEDTSATNFMIRDARMRRLVADEREPITPLLQRVRELYEKEGVSAVLVTGGSGDYLAVADRVLLMDNYRPVDVSAKAAALAGDPPPTPRAQAMLRSIRVRRFEAKRFDARRGDGKKQIVVRAGRLLDYGRARVDMGRVEQLVDAGQLETIGRLLDYTACHYTDHPDGVVGALRQGLIDAEKEGLDILFPWKVGHLALPRLYELAAAANRLRAPEAEKE